MTMQWFNFDHNRSERALQTDLLAPALRDSNSRWAILKRVPGMRRAESDTAFAMHFVWVLRDSFYLEREAVKEARTWQELVGRWVAILGLPVWAEDLDFWRHPTGHKGDMNFVPHPIQKRLGWTEEGLRARYETFSPRIRAEDAAPILFAARKVLNTECDCFVQTAERLIVIECKDKTGFTTEQRKRQQQLRSSIDRLIERPRETVYVEVAAAESKGCPGLTITWPEIRQALRDA